MSEAHSIKRHVLSEGDISVAILSLGCITQDWQVPLDGEPIPVVLGYDDSAVYAHNPGFLGAIVGRVANRISGAGFVSGGQKFHLSANQPPHHLHGGAKGIQTRNWSMETDGDRSVRLKLISEDGDQGFPGRVEFTVVITLNGCTLTYDMTATTNQPTPINLAQHNYYNLLGSGTVLDHWLQIPADKFTPVSKDMIPTGQISGLQGCPVDFRVGKTLARADPELLGLDMNFVLKGNAKPLLKATNGLTLTMQTDQPCLQLFTAPELSSCHPPLAGQDHVAFGGLCLEPQKYPNAPNVPGFPSIIITPDQPYRQSLAVTIAPEVPA